MELTCLATGSSGNCYLLKVGSDTVILDAGIEIEKIIKNVNLNDVKFAFISHEHKDHSKSLEKLVLRGVPIVSGITTHEFTENQKFGEFGALYLIPIQHGNTSNAAIIIKTKNECILYATDFNICEYDLSAFKFTSIIVECNYIDERIDAVFEKYEGKPQFFKFKRQINSHMGLRGLQIFLDTLDLKYCSKIILVHKSTNIDLVDAPRMGLTILKRYGIDTGVCRTNGGIDWYLKEDYE